MKITHVVNKITKTSVPAMWVDAFSRFSNNHSNLTQFKFSLIPTILNADIIHLHQIKSGFLVVFCAFFLERRRYLRSMVPEITYLQLTRC